MRISDWSSDVCSSDLQGEAPLAVLHREHVGAEFLPMAARFPQGAGQELGGAHLAIAGAPHVAPDMAFHRLVEGEAAGMPEHHPGPVLLLVEQALAITDVKGVQQHRAAAGVEDRKRGVGGKGGSVWVDRGGGRIMKKKKNQ